MNPDTGWPEHDEELDQHYDGTDDEVFDDMPQDDDPTTRLSPAAREHLERARAALREPRSA